ncbi:MAG: hypothetical protein ACR2NX_11840 [Chthoniobacterales bacterium]
MRRILLWSALAALCLCVARAEETDGEVEARKVALDLAGAFSNDGFKLRDGHWSGEIKDGSQAVIAVNLYAGNEYWFAAGANDAGKKLSVKVFDENGKPVTTDDYVEENQAAAGFAPTISGQYFVALAPSDGPAGAYCLVCSYK